ncbi:hypothetical protein MTO96_047387 [Rhipicephalus appendiculatus]
MFVERKRWRRKERALRVENENLRRTVDSYKEELRKLKEECYVSAFLEVVDDAEEGTAKAVLLLDQVKNYKRKKPRWSELTIRHGIVMRHLSTKAYEYLRSEELLKLPCRTTLQKYFGSTSGEVGFSQLVRSRLEAELETLDTPQSKVCSLVVDEMRIKQKLIYNKQRDAFVGDVDLGPELEHLAPASDGENLANSLLLIAALKYLRDQAGHSCDIEFASVGPTVEFMEAIHKWFTCMDVSNLQQHIHRNDEDARQFSDTDDPRLEWLEGEFLFYIEQLKTRSRAENYLNVASVAMVGGFIVRAATENIPCAECIALLQGTKANTPLLGLIAHQDRGGLMYPSQELIKLLTCLRRFVDSVLPHRKCFAKPLKMCVERTVEVLVELPLLRCSSTDTDHRRRLMQLIATKFIKPLFSNYALGTTDRHATVKLLQRKPISRKVLKM